MDLSEKSRLEKLLGMLGSSFDGERANAARMISSMAEKKSLSIVELIYGAQSIRPQPSYQAPPRPRPQPRPTTDKPKSNTILKSLGEIAASTEEYEFTLTEWECQFADDVYKRYSYDYELSEKQIVIAEKIIRKAEIARQQGGTVG